MTASRTILRRQLLIAEESSGARLSNIDLGRRLRAQGYSVANDKITAIVKAVRTRVDGGQL